MQLLYLGMIFAGYFVFVTDVQGLAREHLHPLHEVAVVSVSVLSVATHLLTAFSDPGILTAANLKRHTRAYPPDLVVYHHKYCTTCKLVRPARSKHCALCNRCVSRFDHHCGWMNNCIGEGNLRFFLLFLASNTFMCAYGAWMAYAAVLSDLEARGVLDGQFRDGAAVFRMRDAPLATFRFSVFHYPMASSLGLFLGLVSLFLAGFTAFHLALVARNLTTNETYKWAEIRDFLRRDHEERMGEPVRVTWAQWALGREPPGVAVPKNAYDRGLARNVAEAFVLPSNRVTEAPRLRRPGGRAGPETEAEPAADGGRAGG